MYDENRIRVLTEVEKQSHSVDSILSILLDKYPSTSPDHLTRVAECLVTFGWVLLNTMRTAPGRLAKRSARRWSLGLLSGIPRNAGLPDSDASA